jgi:flagellar biosynthesis protein FlhA
LIHPLLDSEGGLRVLVIEQHLEADLVATFDPQASVLLGEGAPRGGHGEYLRKLLESVKRLTGGGSTMALPVLLCPSPARYHVRRWLEPFVPKITVLAPIEIPPEIRVRSVGTVG